MKLQEASVVIAASTTYTTFPVSTMHACPACPVSRIWNQQSMGERNVPQDMSCMPEKHNLFKESAEDNTPRELFSYCDHVDDSVNMGTVFSWYATVLGRRTRKALPS